MVTSPSGKGVIVIGGYNKDEGKKSNALLELKGISSKEWIPLKQTLQHARREHVAISIPADWTIPNTDKAEITTQGSNRKRKFPECS